MLVCNSSTPLGNVEVFAKDNLLLPLVETNVDGTFVLENQCPIELAYHFFKDGYTSELDVYIYMDVHLLINMCKNCK